MKSITLAVILMTIIGCSQDRSYTLIDSTEENSILTCYIDEIKTESDFEISVTFNMSSSLSLLHGPFKINEKAVVNHVYIRKTVSEDWHPDLDIIEYTLSDEEGAEKLRKRIIESYHPEKKSGMEELVVIKNKVLEIYTRAYAFHEFRDQELEKIRKCNSSK